MKTEESTTQFRSYQPHGVMALLSVCHAAARALLKGREARTGHNPASPRVFQGYQASYARGNRISGEIASNVILRFEDLETSRTYRDLGADSREILWMDILRGKGEYNDYPLKQRGLER